jgi:hypothetical protein
MQQKLKKNSISTKTCYCNKIYCVKFQLLLGQCWYLNSIPNPLYLPVMTDIFYKETILLCTPTRYLESCNLKYILDHIKLHCLPIPPEPPTTTSLKIFCILSFTLFLFGTYLNSTKWKDHRTKHINRFSVNNLSG